MARKLLSSRAKLKAREVGVVAVRYEAHGCNVELEVLDGCIGKETPYKFSPYQAADTKVSKPPTNYITALPLGAAKLSGKISEGKHCGLNYLLAGSYRLPAEMSISSIGSPGTVLARHMS